MARAAPRIDPRLLAAVIRVDDPKQPIAETVRRVGAVADALGLSRPSYEQLRVLVHKVRKRQLNPGAGEILLDVAFRNRPPDALLDLVVDRADRRRPPPPGRK
jgi:hypothetical protein